MVQREKLERTEKNLDEINTTLRYSQKNINGIKVHLIGMFACSHIVLFANIAIPNYRVFLEVWKITLVGEETLNQPQVTLAMQPVDQATPLQLVKS